MGHLELLETLELLEPLELLKLLGLLELWDLLAMEVLLTLLDAGANKCNRAAEVGITKGGRAERPRILRYLHSGEYHTTNGGAPNWLKTACSREHLEIASRIIATSC